ncbi:metal-dependent hydrolase [Paenibacillus sp. YAF4_2]|uniref:metal-dependent hydrolase n=1 Tax=Paenibacillus sp. YAF4_2 TaxID=3233085 RepID=UPI003F99E0C6
MELLLHSLIHLAAGASTAYVLCRKEQASILKRCWLLLIGGLAGLFPDFTKFFGDIFFHSVLLIPLAGLLCAFVYRIFQKDISFKQQWLIFSVCVCTHLFIDYIGNGVAFLYPIIEHEYEFSIVQRDDVMVLSPLILALIIGVWFRNGKKVVWAGVIISILYIGALAGFKIKLENALEQRYQMEHVQSLTTYPNEFKREWRFMLTTDQTGVFGHSNLFATDIQIDDENTFPTSFDTALPVEPITVIGAKMGMLILRLGNTGPVTEIIISCLP